MNAPTSNSYSLISNHVFDPLEKTYSSKRIQIKDGTIKSIESFQPAEKDEDQDWDLTEYTVLPSLVDAHIHSYFEPWPLDPDERAIPPSEPDGAEFQKVKERLKETFLAGVGHVRDLGDPLGINLRAVDWSAETCNMPRVVTSGPGLHKQGRYGRFIGNACEDRREMLDFIRGLADDPNVHVIKLVATGIINFKAGKVTAAPPWETEDLKAAVELAHELGKKTVAHGSGEEGIRRAVEAGVDFIEHGYFISKETMELLIEKDLIWTPTFIPVHAQWNHAECCGWDKETAGYMRRILDNHAEMLRFAVGNDARILAGSDAGGSGVSHGGGLWEELWLMEEAGMSAEDLLTIATQKAADWLDLPNTEGMFVPGQPADFVVLKDNPTNGLTALKSIQWVARDGNIVSAKSPRMQSDVEAESYGLNQDKLAAATSEKLEPHY